jgi:hypothetical protein
MMFIGRYTIVKPITGSLATVPIKCVLQLLGATGSEGILNCFCDY